jgi:hypothetical protein
MYHDRVVFALTAELCPENHRCKIDTPNAHIHDRSPYWLDTGTAIKMGGGVILFSGPKPSLLKNNSPSSNPFEKLPLLKNYRK